MYLYVPTQGSPNTELFANKEHDRLPLHDALIMPDELQKQMSRIQSFNQRNINLLMN